jgi:hypothetical protein
MRFFLHGRWIYAGTGNSKVDERQPAEVRLAKEYPEPGGEVPPWFPRIVSSREYCQVIERQAECRLHTVLPNANN